MASFWEAAFCDRGVSQGRWLVAALCLPPTITGGPGSHSSQQRLQLHIFWYITETCQKMSVVGVCALWRGCSLFKVNGRFRLLQRSPSQKIKGQVTWSKTEEINTTPQVFHNHFYVYCFVHIAVHFWNIYNLVNDNKYYKVRWSCAQEKASRKGTGLNGIAPQTGSPCLGELPRKQNFTVTATCHLPCIIHQLHAKGSYRLCKRSLPWNIILQHHYYSPLYCGQIRVTYFSVLSTIRLQYCAASVQWGDTA